MLDTNGDSLELADRGGADHTMLELRDQRQTFRFDHLDAPPVVSLLRGFSAPVKVEMQRNDAELAFLFAHDPDPFNRTDSEKVNNYIAYGAVALEDADERLVGLVAADHGERAHRVLADAAGRVVCELLQGGHGRGVAAVADP